MPNLACPARTKAGMCTAADFTNIKPNYCKTPMCVVHFYMLINVCISVCKTGRCRITIPQITLSETESYPWIILFLVSTIFLEFVIVRVLSRFKILLMASPIISIFLSIAHLVRKSF
jgi:hypothetical protein